MAAGGDMILFILLYTIFNLLVFLEGLVVECSQQNSNSYPVILCNGQMDSLFVAGKLFNVLIKEQCVRTGCYI